MAKDTVSLEIQWRGKDECQAWLASCIAALENAGRDDTEMVALTSCRRGIKFGGALIVQLFPPEGFAPIILTLKPTASIMLFTGWVLAHLPSSARVQWVDGWPHIYCPPSDDRESGAAGPQVPGELVPA